MKTFKVVLIRAGMTQLFGIYATCAEAEKQAAPHRQSGYWSRVEVLAC